LNSFPVTADQHDRYTRRARARVYWGHRKSGIVDSLVRKGVQRVEANEIVDAALTEWRGVKFRALAIRAAIVFGGAVLLGLYLQL
jgi:hypothetical protein